MIGAKSAHLDFGWLSKWIQPQHLEANALRNYRDAYKACAAPVIRIPQFLRSDYAHTLYTFMSFEAEYECVYGLHTSGRVSQEVWTAASNEERMYRYSILQDSRVGVTSINPLIYVKLRAELADPRFISFFQEITCLPLSSLDEIHGNAFHVADFLRPHDDRSFGRYLAFIFYLNPHWKPNYGGALVIVSHNGQRITLEVEYNSLVMFDVEGHKLHYVGDINELAGEQPRLSIGGWYA